jgi:hypothetical protein
MSDPVKQAQIDLIEIALKLYIEMNGAAAYNELIALFETDAAAAEALLADFTEEYKDQIKDTFTASLTTT